jgi:hypothetical protein
MGYLDDFEHRRRAGTERVSLLTLCPNPDADRNGSAGFQMCIKRAEKMALAALTQAEQIACSLRHCALVAASPFPILSGDR